MKLKIHPLFLALGVLAAVFGGLTVFIIYAITALLHECGHIFCAAKLGYDCAAVSVMPYGAAATLNIDGISAADELKLALSGPAVNAALCVAVAGLWWFFPQTYAYTDIIFTANAAMLFINLFPAYPLDGGRALRCVLKRFFKQSAAIVISRVMSFVLAAVLLAVFFTGGGNVTFPIMSGFLIMSALGKERTAQKLILKSRKVRRGTEMKYVLLTGESTYKDALRHLDYGKYVVFRFDDGETIEEFTEEEILQKLENSSLYDKIIQTALPL